MKRDFIGDSKLEAWILSPKKEKEDGMVYPDKIEEMAKTVAEILEIEPGQVK